jgi:hypothetical protein
MEPNRRSRRRITVETTTPLDNSAKVCAELHRANLYHERTAAKYSNDLTESEARRAAGFKIGKKCLGLFIIMPDRELGHAP